MMKHYYRRKLPLSVGASLVLFSGVFSLLTYTERITPLSFGFRPILKLKLCTRKEDGITDVRRNDATGLNDPELDERLEFDSDECGVVDGKWVYDSNLEPLYTDTSCPYLDRQVSCIRNGRNDSDYLRWVWQPDDCLLPPFNAARALERLRGKRLMFVGDSLQREQWQSFVCMIQHMIPAHGKSMKRSQSHSIFRVNEYNCSIEFYWAPFLVESNTDGDIIADPKKRMLRVDSVSKHAKHWTGVDVLVFNTYVWWMSVSRVKSLWGSFSNAEDAYEELEVPVAYRIGLKTWANWVDSNINPNTTKVFFTTMSPTHLRAKDWNREGGIKCFDETMPVRNKKNHWGSGSNKRVMSVVSGVLGRMKVPVTILNITQLSEYRIDGHTSIYTEADGHLLTDEQKADPLHYADCIHWCLPGIPDTWNRIFYAQLLSQRF
ncbi:hypothetical protein MLD38_032645 [Melastoma candidum]|uniref:Uncharacterized protein n=1 Tax=Melastoma candidum TaxID=119954 RepID=A0ACB9M6H2_9MYRT|nr:hypothetical protein MLD38_032645 [Melastoma candidum]